MGHLDECFHNASWKSRNGYLESETLAPQETALHDFGENCTAVNMFNFASTYMCV